MKNDNSAKTPATQKKEYSKKTFKFIKETKSLKDQVNKYLVLGRVGDFSIFPSLTKLAYFLMTPKQYVKTRKIGKVQIPYVEHFYCEKVLNFVCNFDCGFDVISHEITQKKKGGKDVCQAVVLVRHYAVFTDDEGNETRIEKTVGSGHIMYENPATNDGDCLQSAISKSTTKFAKTLGIGADIRDSESKAYRKVTEDIEIDSVDSSMEGFQEDAPEDTPDAIKEAKIKYAKELETKIKKKDENFRPKQILESELKVKKIEELSSEDLVKYISVLKALAGE